MTGRGVTPSSGLNIVEEVAQKSSPIDLGLEAGVEGWEEEMEGEG